MLPILAILVGAVSAAGLSTHSRIDTTPIATKATWYHDDPAHPVHQLFKRAPTGPPVGSDAWKAQFPPVIAADLKKPLDSSKIPKAWSDALDNAINSGRIPKIPVSISGGEGTQPTYPTGFSPKDSAICSSSVPCKNFQLGDLWDAPEGFFATGFDDGPDPASPKLLAFLAAEKIKTTHFLIGAKMIAFPSQFQAIIDSGDDLAVHTWTHEQMTTLSNVDIVAQIGWTMQVIYQSTGKVPRYWRPPTGDADNRVRAIAFHIFGLKTLMWNSESEDYKMNYEATDPRHITSEQLTNTLKGFATGSKNPGRIVLSHETSEGIVQGFIDAYPTIKSSGWQIRPISQLPNLGDPGAYRPAGPANILAAAPPVVPTSASSPSATNPLTSTGTTSTGSTVSTSSTGNPAGVNSTVAISQPTGTPGAETRVPPNSGSVVHAPVARLALLFVVTAMAL